MKLKVSTEAELQIVEMYKVGVTYKEIAKKLGIARSTIWLVLRKQNCVLTRSLDKKTSIQVELQVVELYKQGLSVKDIADATAINEWSIPRIIKRQEHSLDRRYGVTRKHKLGREDFFEEIDSEEKAYFLGLMITDGSVKSSLEGIEITFNQQDAYILDLFRLHLGTEKPLEQVRGTGYSKGTNYARLTVFSTKLVASLLKHGIVPAKSDKTYYPNLSDSALIHSNFIRGAFDGDGCISCNRVGQGRTFNLMGTKALLKGVSESLTKYAGVKLKCSLPIKHNYIHVLSYYSRDNLNKIYNFLYGMASQELWLKRKKQKFETILNSYTTGKSNETSQN